MKIQSFCLWMMIKKKDMKIKKNGKVIRLSESDLKKIVKRVLSEQEQLVTHGDFNVVGSSSHTGGVTSMNSKKPKPNPNDYSDGFITIGYKGDKYGARFNDSDLRAMGGLVGGVLSLIAGTLIKKGITKIIRKRDLKFISKEIGEVLEKELSKEDIKCLKMELSKLGKINRLNDEYNSNKVRSRIGSCLANSNSGITVDQFYDKLEDVIGKWENASSYRKKLRKQPYPTEHTIKEQMEFSDDRGIDFWLEELSEFAIHLENGYYDEYSSLGGYDIENIKDIIRQAREDKSLSDNDLTIVTEYGHDIHKDIIDIISSSGIK